MQGNILNIKGYGVYEMMQTAARMHTSARRAWLGSGILFTKQGVRPKCVERVQMVMLFEMQCGLNTSYQQPTGQSWNTLPVFNALSPLGD